MRWRASGAYDRFIDFLFDFSHFFYCRMDHGLSEEVDREERKVEYCGRGISPGLTRADGAN